MNTCSQLHTNNHCLHLVGKPDGKRDPRHSQSVSHHCVLTTQKTEEKENSALYYNEVYGVMPSGFSCTSRESGRDKRVLACGAQHGTTEKTVLQRKLSSFLSVTVSGASQLLELSGGHDGHDSLGRARHAGERKEGEKGKETKRKKDKKQRNKENGKGLVLSSRKY